MIARIMSTNSKETMFEHFKKIFVATIASTIAWFVLEQTDIPSLYKAISYGIIGVISPEVIHGIVKLGSRFARNPTKFIDRK